MYLVAGVGSENENRESVFFFRFCGKENEDTNLRKETETYENRGVIFVSIPGTL